MAGKSPEATAARAAAARIVAAVVPGGRALSSALPPGLETVAPEQRGLVQELCYGSLRWRIRLQAMLDHLLARPLRRRDADLQALLLIGLYQLQYLRVPPHAAVSETAGAARELGKPWGVRLVNAVLRRFQREADALGALVDRDEAIRLALPAWLVDRLRRDWPRDWRKIAGASNAQAPMTLRVNALRSDPTAYLERLRRAGMAGRPLACCRDAIELAEAVDVQRLPGFADGLVSVQDGAAQLACELVRVGPGMRVLDACAAPGGKTAHLLERAPEGMRLVALDIDPVRLQRVRQGLERLGLVAQLIAGDAATPEAWWDGALFDRILLDAPCSATGVIRRHPEIRHLRRATDIDRLVIRQQHLLQALWPLLRPGGRLVYATCSVLKAENETLVRSFLARRADACEDSVAATWGRATTPGRQILPGEDGLDGFYYACLEKRIRPRQGLDSQKQRP